LRRGRRGPRKAAIPWRINDGYSTPPRKVEIEAEYGQLLEWSSQLRENREEGNTAITKERVYLQ